MRRLNSLFQDEVAEEAVMASRRSMIVGSLKLAGGGALALAIAGTPGIASLAAAQEDQEEDGGGGGQDGGGGGGRDDGQGGGGGGGGRDDGQGGGGGGGRAADGQGGQGAAQVNGVPRTGVGIPGGSDGQTAGLIGLAAAGAAAAAVFMRQHASAEQASDM